MSAQGIECSHPGRAAVKWMRRLSGKKGTEFSPRVPIISQIFPFCLLFRVISYLRHCCGTRIFKFGPILSHSCFSWRLGGPCLCACRLTPDGAQLGRNRDRVLFIEHMIIRYRKPKGLASGKCHLDIQMRLPWSYKRVFDSRAAIDQKGTGLPEYATQTPKHCPAIQIRYNVRTQNGLIRSMRINQRCC